MAQGRFLSSTVAEDIRLNSLSLEAHLLYLMAIPHLDVDGIMPGHPALVFARACPLRNDLRDSIPAIIDEWVQVGLVLRYDSNGEPALFFTGFPKNQKVRRDREAASRYANPPGYMRGDDGALLPDPSWTPPGPLLANSPASVSASTSISTSRRVKRAPAAQDAPPSEPSEHQELFGAICDAVGWDYKTLNSNSKGRVARAAGILAKADYTPADVREFMHTVWANDWRYKKNKSAPTIEQLQQEIGKLKNGANNGTHRQDVEEVDDYDPEFAKRFAEHQARVREQRAAAEAGVSLQ